MTQRCHCRWLCCPQRGSEHSRNAPVRRLQSMTDRPTNVRSLRGTSAGTPAGEPSLFYEPPYGDPLADALAYRLVRTLAPQCALQHRAVVLTPDDCFRVDFLIEHGRGASARRTGLLLESPEEDGGEVDREAADLHDALIVGAGAADVIYRIRYVELERHLLDALYLMARWDAALFRPSGRTWLARHASGPARQAEVRPQQPTAHVHYPSPPVHVQPHVLPERPEPPSALRVRRWSQQHPAPWVRAYSRALQHYDPAQAWPRRA